MKHSLSVLTLLLLLAGALFAGFSLARLGGGGSRAGGAQPAVPAPVPAGQATPVLSLPNAIAAGVDGIAVLPVHLAADGAGVASVLFSLDIDSACLIFNPADADRNGLPDAITLNTPPAFLVSTTYDAGDSDGELDFIVADYSPPYSTLPDGVLLTIRLAVACSPAAGETLSLPLPFSSAPAASFATPSGSALYGRTTPGSILVSSAMPTPVPTATPTPRAQTPVSTIPPTAPATSTPLHTGPPLPLTPSPTPRDDDGDGLYSHEEGDYDWDGDGVPNYLDSDDDDDSIPTLLEGVGDADGNGLPNFLDLDSNDNGIPDLVEVGANPSQPEDIDGDGTWDFLQSFSHLLFLPLIERGD